MEVVDVYLRLLLPPASQVLCEGVNVVAEGPPFTTVQLVYSTAVSWSHHRFQGGPGRKEGSPRRLGEAVRTWNWKTQVGLERPGRVGIVLRTL